MVFAAQRQHRRARAPGLVLTVLVLTALAALPAGTARNTALGHLTPFRSQIALREFFARGCPI